MVYAVYENQGPLTDDDENRRHEGAMELRVQGTPPEGLTGKYWTDRLTRGDLAWSERRALQVASFAAAERLFETTS